MNTERFIKLGQQTALISFLFGTFIFGLYYLTSSTNLLLVGYGFILLAVPVNMGLLIFLLVQWRKDINNRKKLFRTCSLILLNVPVMLCYCWVTIILLNTMRITITNSTQLTLTDINIEGCGNSKIGILEIGESTTVWIDINSDCSINFYYLLNGHLKKEVVLEYVTPLMGRKIKYNIDD